MNRTILKTGLRLLLLFLLLLSQMEKAYALKADFTAKPASGCSPLQTSFKDASTGNPVKWTWRLGDGSVSTQQNPGKIYTTVKSYTITLIVEDGSGNKDSVTKANFITVFANPDADFKASTRGGCPPLNVSFTDLSTKGNGAITNWLWDFGDGQTSTSQHPTHTYTQNGAFDVILIVTDANGCTSTERKMKHIVTYTAPVVDFKAVDSLICAPPLMASFKSFIQSNSSKLTYKWDFGNGQTSTQKDPQFKYTNYGLYDVSLTVTDSVGCSTTLLKKSYIRIGKEAPDFKVGKVKGCVPFNVTFLNYTTPGTAGNSYYWDFGDGGTSTDPSPTYIYGKPGIYSVKLKVVSRAGCTDSVIKTNLITVGELPIVSFTSDTRIGCKSPATFKFRNTSPNATVVQWDFGDYTFSSEENPTKTYADTGYYTVTLTVRSKDGCEAKITKANWIMISPSKADYTVNALRGCIPLKLDFKFTSRSLDTITNFIWDFGDGATSTEKNPSHTYTTPGDYNAVLIIRTKHGCTDSMSRLIKAGNKPKALFTTDTIKGCIQDLQKVTSITNLTNTGTVKADSFYWSIGGGYVYNTNGENPGPVRFRARPGRYSITLAASSHGCTDWYTIPDIVHITPPWAYFTKTYDRCRADSVTFLDSSIGSDSIIYYFGDGDSSFDRNPVHIYKNPGLYFVTQIVKNDSTGCFDRYMDTVNVRSSLKLGLVAEETSGCTPFRVKFYALTNELATLKWDFGDGDSSSARNPIHYYNTPGTYTVTLTGMSEDSCTRTVIKHNYIHALGQQARFSVTPIFACAPVTVKLIDSSGQGQVQTKEYDMGDGTILPVTDQTMYYTYKNPPADQTKGYPVTMRIVDGKCKSSVSRLVTVLRPSAAFIAVGSGDCYSSHYKFVNKPVTGSVIRTYLWDFGDGTTSSQAQPERSYTQTVTRKIKLKVWDRNGCIDSSERVMTMGPTRPKAGFTASPRDAKCPPTLVTFTDTSHIGFAPIKTWKWYFGDGSSSEYQNPQKLYLTPGKFTVSLVITDTSGCSDSVAMPDLVVVRGPRGTYSFDKKQGCERLLVKFKAISKEAIQYTWDLGDGTIAKGDTVTHRYDTTGTYVPLLILTDSFGCSYTLPPIDTIRIEPNPRPNFSFTASCSGLPTYFKDLSVPVKGTIYRWTWDFGDGDTSADRHPVHTYEKPGYYWVKLTTYSTSGCYFWTDRRIRINGVGAEFATSNPSACIGHPLHFYDKSISDTTIVSWNWSFGDGGKSTQQNPSHTYMKKGLYTVILIAKSITGCSDTLFRKSFLAGDTVPPPEPVIYRATVEDDHTVRLDFSRFRDVDFGKYLIYRSDGGSSGFTLVDSVKVQNDTVYYDRGRNTLHNSYCYRVQAVNACGYYSGMARPPHCTVELQASAGINKALLRWNPYYGWKEVARYNIFREDVNRKGFYWKIDSVPGTVTKYTDSNIICYATHTYRVMAVEQNGYRQVSWSDTATTKPIYIPNVPGTELVRATVEDNKNIRIEWKDVPRIRLKHFYLEKSPDGRAYSALGIYPRGEQSVLDKKVDVQERPYYYRVRLVDSCGDIGPWSNIGKTIHLKADTTAELRPRLQWTRYREWAEGVYYYDIEQKQPDGSFRTIAQTAGPDDTLFVDEKTDLNSLPWYCYRVTAHRAGTIQEPKLNIGITSTSNEGCVPVRSIIWVPNVFTPNEDSLNDRFMVQGMFIKSFRIQIYDRWGTLVYESDNMKEGWDGRYKAAKPLQDAYRYLITAKGADNTIRHLYGWVTVLP